MKKILKSRLLEIVFLSIETTYIIVASIFGFPFWVSIITGGLLLAVYVLVLLLKKDLVPISIVDTTKTYKTILNSLCELCDLCKNDNAKQELCAITEDFRFSDPVSNKEMWETEDCLISKIDELKQMIENNDYDNIESGLIELKAYISTRSRLCQYNK